MPASSLQEELNRCFALFDQGLLQEAEAGYLACLKRIHAPCGAYYVSAMMGLAYVTSALGKHEKARHYAAELLRLADNEEARHIALHQMGMVERVAKDYDKAQQLFEQEKALILTHFPDDTLKHAANSYELAYIKLLQGIPGEALSMMKDALENAQASGDAICLGCAQRGMGEIYAVMGEAKKAMESFEKARLTFLQGGDERGAQEVAEMMGQG
ncbi:MAG: tetratricopeptide repeat protein [Christensenellales bacterium]